MKKQILTALAAGLLMTACGGGDRNVTVRMDGVADGTEVSVIAYDDSASLVKGVFTGGEAHLTVPSESDVLTMVMVDGKRKGYYVAERGEAVLSDGADVAIGTPGNEAFGRLMQQMDSLDKFNDEAVFLPFMLEKYNSSRDNAVGYFAINYWMRLAEPDAVDSLLKTAPASIRGSKRVAKNVEAAALRRKTAVGSKYVDFSASQPDGRIVSLSQLIDPGKYVLVDFWASWCPYCIKEIPKLKEMQKRYPKLQIIGVAVRDEEADTKAMVEKKEIPWTVMYNAGRVPYDIYGIGGIPHAMLLAPDGTILSRGESVARIDARMSSMM